MEDIHVQFQNLLCQKHSVKFSEGLLELRVTTCEKRERGSMDEIHVQFQDQLCQTHTVNVRKEGKNERTAYDTKLGMYCFLSFDLLL